MFPKGSSLDRLPALRVPTGAHGPEVGPGGAGGGAAAETGYQQQGPNRCLEQRGPC